MVPDFLPLRAPFNGTARCFGILKHCRPSQAIYLYQQVLFSSKDSMVGWEDSEDSNISAGDPTLKLKKNIYIYIYTHTSYTLSQPWIMMMGQKFHEWCKVGGIFGISLEFSQLPFSIEDFQIRSCTNWITKLLGTWPTAVGWEKWAKC